MDTILQLSQRQRVELFESAALKTGLDAVILEKDFWVCWTLKELVRKGVATAAMAKPELLARVAQHKNLFFKTSWARYGEATKGTLHITPPEHRLKALRDDYTRMQQMCFGTPPEFDKIIALLNQWESAFNQK